MKTDVQTEEESAFGIMRIPNELITQSLSFLSVPSLLQLEAVSKQFSERVNCMVNKKDDAFLKGSNQRLSERYWHLKTNREIFDDLLAEQNSLTKKQSRSELLGDDESAGELFIDSIVGWYQKKGISYSNLIILNKSADSADDFFDILGICPLTQRSKSTGKKSYSFLEFMHIVDKLIAENSRRKSVLFRYHNRAIENVPASLTEDGLALSKAYFDFFDVDNDNRLNWTELGNLNLAAGLPLTAAAYRWVQQSFATDVDGLLTFTGYRDMFLDNFVRVPHLMYHDIVRINEFIANALEKEKETKASEGKKKRTKNSD